MTDKLPTSGEEMFTGGQLLGTFEGPATSRQIVQIEGQEILKGRYVLLQQTAGGGREDYLNFHEVRVWGPVSSVDTDKVRMYPRIDNSALYECDAGGFNMRLDWRPEWPVEKCRQFRVTCLDSTDDTLAPEWEQPENWPTCAASKLFHL